MPATATVPLYTARIGHRQFTAAVKYRPVGGFLVSAPQPTRKSAIKALEAKLLGHPTYLAKSVPVWDVRDQGDLTVKVPAPKPEVPTAESTIAHLNNPNAAAKPVGTIPAREPEVTSAPAPKPVLPTTPPVAPTMDGGFVTPRSDKAAWIDVYRQTTAKFDGIDFPGENPREKVANYRRTIGDLMESISFIAPWRRTPGGDTWLTISGEKDHTIRLPKAGDGRHRERFHKNINGNTVEVQRDPTDSSKLYEHKVTVTDSEVQALLGEDAPRRAPTRKEKKAERQAAHKAAKAASAYKYPGSSDAYNAAFKYGRELQKAAAIEGHDRKVKTQWFKLGVCRSLHSQGALPHAKYEADLVACGYTDEAITGISKAA